MSKTRKMFVVLFVLGLQFISSAQAQQEVLVGQWIANLTIDNGGQFRFVFNVSDSNDVLDAQLILPDQGGAILPIEQVTVQDKNIRLDIKAANAVYEGLLNDDGISVQGVFIQGDTTELILDKMNTDNSSGVWVGKLHLPDSELHIVFDVMEKEGLLVSTFGSPDQGAMGIKVDETVFTDSHLNLDLSSIGISFNGELSEDGYFLNGSFIQGDTLELNMKRYGRMPELPKEKKVVHRPQTPQAPYPYHEELVQIQNKSANVVLAGTLTKPQTDGPFPAVILIHGSGRNDRNGTHMGHFHLLADYLTRKGFVVLRYDKRGVGESTGDYGQVMTQDFKDDVAAAVDYLKTRADINKESIGLIGHSEGGLIAPMVASENMDISYIVMMAGVGQTFGEAAAFMRADDLSINGGTIEEVQTMRDWYESFYNVVATESDSTVLFEKVHSLYNTLSASEMDVVGWSDETIEKEIGIRGWTWFVSALHINPFDYIKNVKCPVLAVTGEKDRQVNPTDNLAVIRSALQKGNNPDYMVQELKGLNHLFQTCETGMISEYDNLEEIIAPSALELIGDWTTARAGDALLSVNE